MVEQRLRYGDLQIPYRVYFIPNRKRKIAIHIHPDGSVQVDSPPATPLREIRQAVSKRARWINTHVSSIREKSQLVLPREYVSGESHFYMGKRYILKIRKPYKEQSKVKLLRGQLQVFTADRKPGTVKNLLWQWYVEHSKIIFEKKIEELCNEISWIKKYPEWTLRVMKKQWGSCSPNGKISLNPHLIKAPGQYIDYVIMHELCHLKIHNHSKAYYKLLTKTFPEWEAVKNRLDGMSELILNS